MRSPCGRFSQTSRPARTGSSPPTICFCERLRSGRRPTCWKAEPSWWLAATAWRDGTGTVYGMTSTLFSDTPFGNEPLFSGPSPTVASSQPAAAAPAAQGAKVIAATDGSALGNPGPAAWAWVVEDNGDQTSGCWASGSVPRQTNNWGELTALAELLKVVPVSTPLEIRMDSTYALKAATEWLAGWKRRNWKTAGGQPVKNLELVQDIDRLMTARRNAGTPTDFKWVKAHKTDGTGDPLNEAADRRAFAAATQAKNGRPGTFGPGWTR